MDQGRRPRILIVEDEGIVARDLQETLTSQGYDAYAIAASAEEAIERASEIVPDVVLLDIRIKGELDGIETAEILSNRFGVPVVYLTAYADAATIDRAKKTSPHGYLLKPVKSAELKGAIEVCLYKHETERQLRERERWYATTLKSIADAVVSVDPQGKISFVNAAAETLLGLKSADLVGRPAQEVMRLRDEKAGELLPETPLDRVLRDGRVIEVTDVSLLDVAGGAERLINDSVAPVVDDNRLLGAVMVFHDVTEQKKIQKQLELADRMASLGTMAAGIAHEVNNPLAVVVANATYVAGELELLQNALQKAGGLGQVSPTGGTPAMQADLAEITRALDDVQAAASRISRIVSDLRSFSRPATPAFTTADVVRAMEWSMRMTSHELRQRAQVRSQLEPVPEVEADETKLVQVFVNLLINAAHAIPPGNERENEISVTTRFVDGLVHIEVSDTGEGMPETVQRRIFEPFFTTKPPGKGTGLGLSICHGIVTSLGGEIVVESAAGRGTRVRVSLQPAVGRAKSDEVAVKELKRMRRGRLLVVDDEIAVLRSIARVLRGHDVVATESGSEALKLLERQRFDLVLLDLVMPNMSGKQFYERVLREFPAVAPRIVFMTGGSLTAQLSSFLEALPNARFEKPFQIDRLLATIESLLPAP